MYELLLDCLPDRVVNKIVINQVTGCWEWLAYRKGGYGQIRWNGRMWRAHRAVYTMLVGDIGALNMDHLCRVRHCVNPDHLEPVTVAENNKRKTGVSEYRLRSHCQNGHELTEDNLVWSSNSTSQSGRGRRCRTCYNAWDRERYQRDRAVRLHRMKTYRDANKDALNARRRTKRAEK